MDRFINWITGLFAESVGYVFILSLAVGSINAIARFFSRYFLAKIGITYFEERRESFRWIGTKLIMAMALLRSNRASFYTLENGKPYLDISEFSKEDLLLYHINGLEFSKTSSRGVNPLPGKLNLYKYYDLIVQVIEGNNFSENTIYDLEDDSILRNNLIQYGIESYLTVKIESDGKLYGFVIFTWDSVKNMPRNLSLRKYELINEMKTTITQEYLTVLKKKFFKKKGKI